MAEADTSETRAGNLSHAVDRNELEPGDQIYCYRGLYTHHGIYIGEPDCEVIHFSGDDKGSLVKKIGRQEDETMRQLTELSTRRDDLLNNSSTAEAEEIQQQIDEIYEGHVSIRSATLDDFLDGATVRLVSYGSSKIKKGFTLILSSCHYVNAMPPSETVKLAKHFFHHPVEWGNYKICSNNCETFATFCKTGHMEIATQLNQIFRNVFSEIKIEPSCETAAEALRKYREQYKNN